MNLHMSDWAFDYVRHVLEEKGWTAADLARLAGVSHSTINRPLKTPGWKSSLSRTTLAKIAEVSGIDPTPFAPPGETIAPPPATPANVAMIPVYDVAASAGNGAVVEYEPIAEQLAFPDAHVSRTLTVAGEHAEWDAHNVVQLKDKVAIFEPVSLHVASIASKFTMFSDLSRRGNMALTALVEDPTKLGSKGQLLYDVARVLPAAAGPEALKQMAA